MKITLPHKFQPREYQLPFLQAMDGGKDRAVIVWNRRSGKDKVCFNFIVKRAFERVGTYFYFLPTYSQAKKVIWDNIDNDGFRMLEHIPKEVIKNTNATELKIELKNGSIIQLIGADEFKKSGVGTNPIGVVFSEYSLNNSEAWGYIRPILAANKGWAVFNFTPRGMNHAHKLLVQAQANDKWFTEILTVDDTKVLTAEQLAEEKAGMPQDLFEQEYYCKFIEGASQFFRRVDENTYDADAKPDPIRTYQMGIDLAKTQDYTVLTFLDKNSFKVHKQERFNQLDYVTQKAKIEAAYLRYGKPMCWIDSTGVGEPIYDDLVKQGLRIQPFKFTEASRTDLLRNLQLLLEQDKIKIPRDETLLGELKSFQYSLTPSGKVKAMVPEGVHDDTVMSLALACWQLPSNPLPIQSDSLRYFGQNRMQSEVNTDFQ